MKIVAGVMAMAQRVRVYRKSDLANIPECLRHKLKRRNF